MKSVFDCQSPNKLEIMLWDIYPNMDRMSAVIPWDNIIIDGRSYYLEWTGDISDNSIYELSLMIYNIYGIMVSNHHMISTNTLPDNTCTPFIRYI